MAEWHHFSVNRALDTDMEYEQGGNLWVDRFAKPKGLWVAPGDTWAEWVHETGGAQRTYKYKHAVAFGPRVCVLGDVAAFDSFCLKYGYAPTKSRYYSAQTGRLRRGATQPVHPHNLLPLPPVDTCMEGGLVASLSHYIQQREKLQRATGHEAPFYLHWSRIFADYAGLVVAPYMHERRHVHWYYGWDVPGGVIWDLRRAELRLSATAELGK